MKKFIVIFTCILLVLTALAGSIVLHAVNSPEYALERILADVKKRGFDAVEEHLTDETREKLEPIIELTENRIFKKILSRFTKSEYAGFLMEKAKEIDWEMGEIAKSHNKAYVTIGFDYNDGTLEGSVDLELFRIDGEWKINGLTNFKIY